MKVTKLFLAVAAFVTVSCGDAGLAGPAAMPSLRQAALEEEEQTPTQLDDVARYVTPPVNGVERVTQVIGRAGGSVRLHDFEVIVPPGAVSRDTRFEIRILPVQAGDQMAWAQFKPHNQKFAVPVILRVPYASTESAGADARVLWWSGGSWTALPTSVTPDGRLETVTDHFSTYATQRLRGITVIGG